VRPYTLIAELTYRCPLRCPYCSNPADWASRHDALTTEDWCRVLREVEALGVVQLNLTGGEPLLRRDLEAIVAEAARLDLYSSLITSGLPLTRERLAHLADLGLTAVQLSVQDTRADSSDRIAGTRSFDRKMQVARWVKQIGLPLTLNMVLHRDNLAHVAEAVAMAEAMGAERLELANTQYLGWALFNRAALMPDRAALDAARTIALAARDRLRGRIEVLFVTPDYWADRPKACMDGWGRRSILVSPDGLALPCHAAHTIPGLTFDNVRDRPLGDIWRDGAGFNAFRGEDWMRDPCRTCDRRGRDFGGCRCQAYHLTGNAAEADPVCALSPHHALVSAARTAPPAPMRHRAAHARRAIASGSGAPHPSNAHTGSRADPPASPG